MKHTPGPWRFRLSAHNGCYYVEDKDWLVAEVAGQNVENEHNARLIASAPDLLEALKAVRCFYENAKHLSGDEDAILEEARAAIAKAEGV